MGQCALEKWVFNRLSPWLPAAVGHLPCSVSLWKLHVKSFINQTMKTKAIPLPVGSGDGASMQMHAGLPNEPWKLGFPPAVTGAVL